VSDAESSTEVDLICLEDLRTDVGMHPHQVSRREFHRTLHGLECNALGQAETELGILLAGLHELVRVGLDSRRDAQK
jgi:hypothetical protein